VSNRPTSSITDSGARAWQARAPEPTPDHERIEPTMSAHTTPSAIDGLILDIGADIGALIIRTGAARTGDEIEISPRTEAGTPDARRVHNVVRPRQGIHGVSHSAVFPDLAAGEYVVWSDAHTPHGTVTITGGTVSTYGLDDTVAAVDAP
jgi:hypothetical protein